ncbi:MAG: polyprenyl synthetase family protein [Gammaproteobacteria bacterium]|nr:polyprenyl synthetase family protein [Gammaproteobacteria bacterium]
MNDFESACRSYRERTERALAARLPGSAAIPARLGDAMRYVCLGGGKRFRAMLVYACGETAGAAPGQLDAPAAAVEMMHAYSLAHDDLPAMDDDDLRRGRPTCHIAFDEATAILAGDALQTLAFETLSADPALSVSAARRLRMIETLAAAGGARGMAGGQALDMQATGAGPSPDVAHLARIHRLKTGALIRAAARLGGLAAERADDALFGQLDHYAASVGLAFQITDDILDVEAGPGGGALGKHGGADQRMHKATYAGLLGVEKAKMEARNLCENALETTASLGDNAAFLANLARFAVNRSF